MASGCKASRVSRDEDMELKVKVGREDDKLLLGSKFTSIETIWEESAA